MAETSTTEQLRDDIDRGRTGDKVRAGDPAAAPLGTDEEAAGTPTPGAAVTQAREYERRRGPHPAPQGVPGSPWPRVLAIVAALSLAGLFLVALTVGL